MSPERAVDTPAPEAVPAASPAPEGTPASVSTPTPANEVAPVGSDTSPAVPDADDFNWHEFGADLDKLNEDEPAIELKPPAVTPDKTEEVPPAVAVPPTAPVVEVQPVADTPPATPEVAPAPPDTSQAAAAQVLAAQVPDPKVEEEQLVKERERLSQELERKYAMTEDDGVEFVKAPEKVLPRLFANVHAAALENTVGVVQQILPQLVEGVLQRVSQAATVKRAFDKAWPALADAKYTDKIRRLSDLYRAQNPQASTEQFIQEVGTLAHVTLRIPLPEAQATPAATPIRAAPAPFVPPAPGAGTPPVQAQKPLNEFEQLAVEMLEDDTT